MKKFKGQLTISRRTDNRQDHRYFTITIEDATSGTHICDVDVDGADFADVLTGLAVRPCEGTLHGVDLVNCTRENKWFEFNGNVGHLSPAGVASREQLKTEGWRFRERDLDNHHNYVRNRDSQIGSMRLHATRFTDPDGKVVMP